VAAAGLWIAPPPVHRTQIGQRVTSPLRVTEAGVEGESFFEVGTGLIAVIGHPAENTEISVGLGLASSVCSALPSISSLTVCDFVLRPGDPLRPGPAGGVDDPGPRLPQPPYGHRPGGDQPAVG
jgi:hypothetical protein